MKYDMNAMMNMVDTLSVDARKECTAKAQGYAALSESVDEINEKCSKSPIIMDIMGRYVTSKFVETPTAEQINEAINTGYIVNSIVSGYLGHCFADQEINNAYVPFANVISEGYTALQNAKVFAAISANEKDEIANSYLTTLTTDIESLIRQFTIDFTSEGMLPSDFESYVNGLIDNVHFRTYATADENQTEEQHHMFIRNQAYDEYINLCIVITAINMAANSVLVSTDNSNEEVSAPAEPEMMTTTVETKEAPVEVPQVEETALDCGVPAGEGGEPAPDNAIEVLE